MVATATDVPLGDDIDGMLPAVPPDPDLLTEIGDELGLGSSLTRFRAIATRNAASAANAANAANVTSSATKTKNGEDT